MTLTLRGPEGPLSTEDCLMCSSIRTEDGREYPVVSTGFDKYKDKVVVALLVLILGGVVTAVYKVVTEAPLRDERIGVLQKSLEGKASGESVAELGRQIEKLAIKMDDRFTGRDHDTYASGQNSRDSGQDLAIAETRAENRQLSRELLELKAKVESWGLRIDGNGDKIDSLKERVIHLEGS